MQETRVQFPLGPTNFQLSFLSFSYFLGHQTFLFKTSNLRNHPSFRCSEGRVTSCIKGFLLLKGLSFSLEVKYLVQSLKLPRNVKNKRAIANGPQVIKLFSQGDCAKRFRMLQKIVYLLSIPEYFNSNTKGKCSLCHGLCKRSIFRLRGPIQFLCT